MEINTEKIIKYIVFVPLSIIFLPAFLIVNLLHKTWSKWLTELFGL